MSKGGSTTQTQQSTVDPAVQAQWNNIYGMASNAASTPYSYTAPLAAPLSSAQNLGISNATTNANNAQNVNGYGLLSGLMGQNAGTVAGSNLSQYMNPYTQNVIDTTNSELQRQNTIANQGNGDNAIAAGAFGGDRLGVQNAETNRGYAQVMANTDAGLNQANFTNAQSMANQDIQNTLAQQTLGTQQAGLGINAQQQAQNSLFGMGNTAQATQQNALSTAYQNYLYSLLYPQQAASGLASTMRGQPYNTTTSAQTPYYTNPLAGILGGTLAASTPLGGVGGTSLLGGIGNLLGI